MTPRVRVRDYGTLAADDARLVRVPRFSTRDVKLHWAAAQALGVMNLAWCASAPSRHPICVASGWRPHRWASREQYESVLRDKYGSVEKGRVFLAFDSPHETGLAMDIGSHGLSPNSRTVEAQRRTALWQWLDAHAGEFGWTPYEPEAWHWEYCIPRETWELTPEGR